MARKVLLATVCVLGFAGATQAQSPVIVNGYYRSNGNYVQSYYRTYPDHNFYNNWSTYPNINPYTGQMGTHYSPSYYSPYSSYSPTYYPSYGASSYPNYGASSYPNYGASSYSPYRGRSR